MQDLFRRALDHAGYTDSATSAETVVECFKDYRDAGMWPDIEPEEIKDISPETMATAILRLR